VLYARAAGLVNRHYHPQAVFAYTISGKWGYLEHEWVATAGDWVYEAPGEAHTLVAYEHTEPMKVTFNVTGPLIWLDENGDPDGTFDVFDYIALCREHYDKVGIGSSYIDSLMR
jgi:2,4'-dihydroxyacetophenone dioxygenase